MQYAYFDRHVNLPIYFSGKREFTSSRDIHNVYFSIEKFTHTENFFGIFLDQTKFGLQLHFFDWFGAKHNSISVKNK